MKDDENFTYDKEARKKAKASNFGYIFGQTKLKDSSIEDMHLNSKETKMDIITAEDARDKANELLDKTLEDISNKISEASEKGDFEIKIRDLSLSAEQTERLKGLGYNIYSDSNNSYSRIEWRN